MTELSPGDALANTLDDAKRRERILAEVGAVRIDPDPVDPIGCFVAQAEESATQAYEAQHRSAERTAMKMTAVFALAAIEAIDKENGR